MTTLPNPNRRRRNAPTFSPQALPAGGRKGRVPNPPKWCQLGEAGTAWWRWAWKTPQACAWPSGSEDTVARRASLVDDLAALETIGGLDICDVLDAEYAKEVKTIVARVAALTTGRLTVMREMRDLDDRLGLSPRAMAAMHWAIAPEPERATVRTDDVRERVRAVAV
jgi:hypothetical protein